MRKILAFVLIPVLLTACNQENTKNISTSEAHAKYRRELAGKTSFCFPEKRENPLKWYDSIPEVKLQKLIRPAYYIFNARPGEIFVYQVGIWAVNNDISDVQVEFSDLKGKKNTVISSYAMTCFNLGGKDFRGRDFKKLVGIRKGRVQALWMAVDLDGVGKGSYRGSVAVAADGSLQVIPLIIKVSGEPVANHGYDEGAGLSRLNWLNSVAGANDSVPKGFLPVAADGRRITILGRSVEIAANGLPASITSYFGPSNQSLTDRGQPIVKSPFRFIIEKEDGTSVKLVPGRLSFTSGTPSEVSWEVLNTSDEFDLKVNGRMEFDGFMDYSMRLKPRGPVRVKDIRLEIPVEKESSRYMMGLGREGGDMPEEWKWKWDVSKNQDMVWIGAVNGGLRLKLKAENFVRPLINVYYSYGPLKMPPSWGNNGRGGVDLTRRQSGVEACAYSGRRALSAEEVLNFNFELLITPFKVIDRKIKFDDRYFHGGGKIASVKVDSAKKYGANIINIHHAEDIYPFINYPYLDANIDELRQLVSNAHRENIRLKLYYTTREFTKNLPEFWAFNSLNGEIVYPGPGNSCKTVINPDGPRQWYIKNLRENYIPAWYNEIKEGKFKGETDLSVISVPDSRLNNFYVAGLEWMVRNLGIDGVYIDDSALDRYTLIRARKIIDRRPMGRMDLHSWNHFNEWAGFASCLNLYMDLLPYFDLLWIGEGRNYDRAPDHWLVEVSGMPFGLPGQMLEGGGNPWRGMVYGITTRAGYLGISPSGLWKFFDDHRMDKKTMIGYWEDEPPVRTSSRSVIASVYKDDSEAIVAVANWSDQDQKCSVSVAWPKLGMDKSSAGILVPEIEGFQAAEKSVDLEKMTVPAKKGFLIVLTRGKN